MPRRKQKDAPALFAPLRGKGYKSIGVNRKDPPSGYLGSMPPDLTAAALAQRWGGGSYRLEARNARNQVKSVRMIRLDGEPIGAPDLARAAATRRPRRMAEAEALTTWPRPAPRLAREATPQRIEITVSAGECPACGGPLPLPAIVLRTGPPVE